MHRLKVGIRRVEKVFRIWNARTKAPLTLDGKGLPLDGGGFPKLGDARVLFRALGRAQKLYRAEEPTAEQVYERARHYLRGKSGYMAVGALLKALEVPEPQPEKKIDSRAAEAPPKRKKAVEPKDE